MDNNDIAKKLEEQSIMLKEIYKSCEKTRKYFQWTLIVTVITIVLPLLALVFIIPWFLRILTQSYGI